MPSRPRRARRICTRDLPEAHRFVLEMFASTPDGLHWEQLAERAAEVGIGEDEFAVVLGMDGRLKSEGA